MEKNKNYIICTSVDCPSEFTVRFFDVLNEDQFERYMYCKKVLENFFNDYYFGNDEGWDEDFNYLGFTPEEISESELSVFKKYKITGEKIYDKFIWAFSEELCDLNFLTEDEEKQGLENLPIDVFKEIVDEYKACL